MWRIYIGCMFPLYLAAVVAFLSGVTAPEVSGIICICYHSSVIWTLLVT